MTPTDELGAPNYWLPALEIAALYGAGAVWYVIDDRNVLDWDYPSAQQRLTGEAWRFDSNGFGMNFFGHPLAGTGAYMLARGNRLGVWPSWGYALAGSVFWEFGVEFNEKISINDMVVTPGAALPFGEFFHKLGGYVSSAPATSEKSVLAWTLGLTVRGHRELEGIEAPAGPLDELGFSAAYWHHFTADFGFGSVRLETGERPMNTARASARLVSLPGYRRAAELSTWFYQAEFSSMAAEFEGAGSALGVDLFSEALVAGYHWQARLPGARSSFTSFTVASSIAYEYRDNDGSGFSDLRGLLHAPGVAVDVLSEHGPLASSLSIRAAPSFGALSAPHFSAAQPAEAAQDKAVLERYGYFYGAGPTLSAAASVRLEALV
ncbi:MAG: hypothetical protein RJA70_4792, partial [Pseudomonadota bacterium]